MQQMFYACPGLIDAGEAPTKANLLSLLGLLLASMDRSFAGMCSKRCLSVHECSGMHAQTSFLRQFALQVRFLVKL